MGVEQEFQNAISGLRADVLNRFISMGQRAVDYAKANGSYHDVTGTLRRSNTYEATEDMLVVRNTADYASDVESRGEDVLRGAILQIRGELGQ